MRQQRRADALPSKRAVKIVCKLLLSQYPLSSLGNKRNPLDEFIYILLSQRTHHQGYEAAYRAFKKRYPTWLSAHAANSTQIGHIIRPGGLANQKATRIKQAFRFIQSALGELSLRSLRYWPRDKVEHFLIQLPGIGLKSARCIMMYSLGYQVLPVDTHVARIAMRLGWLSGHNMTQVHQHLERVVPPRLRFLFHVCCVQHGRAICTGPHAKCQECLLEMYCPKLGVALIGDN